MKKSTVETTGTTHPGFGQALQALRERRGLSRKEFGRPMGWRADVLKKYESGSPVPGLDVIVRIFEAYDCTFIAGMAGMAFLDNQPPLNVVPKVGVEPQRP